MATPAENLSSRVGERVRALREAKGWNPVKLAAEAGMSLEGIRLIERGAHSPTLATLEKLCAALGCDLTDLLPPGSNSWLTQGGDDLPFRYLPGTAKRRFQVIDSVGGDMVRLAVG